VNSTGLAALKESSLAFWQERKPRERATLLIGAAVVLVALFYALVIAPAIEARQELEKSLPSLRQQATELQALSQEAVQFGSTGAAPPPAPTRETIESSLRSKGLKAQSIVTEGGLVRMQLTAVSFAALLEWLNEAQKIMRLAVVDANIVAQPSPDVVNATLTLRQHKSGNAE
jgi:general secretion pathway protein M